MSFLTIGGQPADMSSMAKAVLGIAAFGAAAYGLKSINASRRTSVGTDRFVSKMGRMNEMGRMNVYKERPTLRIPHESMSDVVFQGRR